MNDRVLSPRAVVDINETCVVTSIAHYNDTVQASILYRSAAKVFRSLPPLLLLEDFHQEEYDSWYKSRFPDPSDDWNRGPTLHADPTPDHGDFWIITPTSDRMIFLQMYKGKLDICRIIFPDGSVNAAASIICAVQSASKGDEQVTRRVRSLAQVKGLNASGPFYTDAKDIAIERIDDPVYDTYSYQIHTR